MPEHFQRPENALKRAEEFLEVAKPKAAQEVLLDVIKSKRHRNWSKVHEEIMDKLIRLNVQLKDSKAAKESLFQYKLTCHSVNVKSLEDTVRKYLQLAELRVQEAQQESKKLAGTRKTDAAKKEGEEEVEGEEEIKEETDVLQKIEDLDTLLTPEDMMLGAVTGEGTQERADIEILIPWIKFLWDAYRNCLDLLRNNKLVERLYQEIAKLAMGFCVKYDRKNEFRRLSDSLRTHLNQIARNTKSQNAISLTNPESQALHLDIRICQLDFGIKIELWQEAFKAVEDIYFLMTLPKRAPHPQKLAEFYQKLGVVFCRASMNLFHACTQHKLFKLTRDLRKNLSQQELSILAAKMLVSTLSIPITEVKHGLGKMLDIESALQDKHQKMSRLLELERSPSRSSLISDMVSRYGVLRLVPKPMIKLYNLIEAGENTLKIKDEVEAILSWIENHENAQMRELHNLYANKVRNVMASRILIQVSKLYMTIKFPRLIKLLPNMSRAEVERMIVDASRIGQLRVRIDHSKDMIKFGLESDPAPLYVDDEMAIDPMTACRQDQNEWVSNHLNSLSRVLETAIIQLRDDEEIKKAARTKNYNNYLKARQKESSRLKNRREEIEERIEDCEREERERVNREREKRQKALNDAESERATKEQREKDKSEARRKEEEAKADQIRQASEKLESMKKTDLGSKLFKDLTPEMLLTRNMEELFDERVELLRKSKKEDQEKLRKMERTMDYFERAKRQVELPKIEAFITDEGVRNRQLWDKSEEERLSRMREDWEHARATKARLSVMNSDAEAFKNVLKKERRESYLVKKKTFDGETALEREKRLNDRRLQRMEDRREKWLEECVEEERIRQEEENRIKEEKRLAEIEARQRADDEEKRIADEKRRQQVEDDERKRASTYRPPVRSGGGWGGDRGRDMSPDDRRGPPRRDFDRRSPPRRSPPRRGVSPPRRQMDRSPPRRGVSPPRRGASPPRAGAWRPGGGRDRSPPRRDLSPRGGGGAWRPGAGRDSSPPAPVGRDRSPPARRLSPARGGDAWRRGGSPPRRGNSPPRRSPPRRGASPPRGGGGWKRGGSSPPRRGNSPPRRAYSPPARRGSPPRRGASPPRRDAPAPWRAGPRDAPRDAPRDRAPPRALSPAKPVGDDGWSTAVDKKTRK